MATVRGSRARGASPGASPGQPGARTSARSAAAQPKKPSTAAPKRKPQRQAVLVLGTHRSGTSALAGILGKLGAQPPKSLMPANEYNARGYWESQALMEFHDEVLQSAGSRWSDWGAFNPDWKGSGVADRFRKRLSALIESEFDDAPLILVKDPRISRFAPLWLESLTALSITPKVVIPIRHPLEVAQSLQTRDEFGRKRGELIWLRHMLDAEFATRGVQRTFVRYDTLLLDWRAQTRRIGEQLAIHWPRWSGEVEAEIDQFLVSSLRHNRVGKDDDADPDAGMGDWARSSYRALRQLADGKGSPDAPLAALDAVREVFDSTCDIYGAVVREQEILSDARVNERSEAIETLNGRLAADEQALSTAHETLEVRNNEIATWVDAHRASEAERARMQDEYQATLDVRNNEIATWVDAHRASEAERARMQDEYQATLEVRNNEIATRVEAHRASEAELARMQDEYQAKVAALNANFATAEQALSTAHQTLDVCNNEIATWVDAHRASEAERARMQDEYQATLEVRNNEIATRVEAHRASEAERARMQDEYQAKVAELNANLATAKQALSTAHETLEVRNNEIATRVEAHSASEAERARMQDEYQAKVAELNANLATAKQALSTAHETLEVRNNEIATRVEAHRASEAERARMQAEYQAKVAALNANLATAEQALSTAHETLEVRDNEIATRVEAHSASEAERARMQDEYQATVSTLSCEAAARDNALNTLHDDLETTKAALEERFIELAQMGQLLLEQEQRGAVLAETLSQAQDEQVKRDAAYETAAREQERETLQLHKKHGQEMENLRTDLASTHGQEMENLRADLDRTHGQEMEDLRADLARTHGQEMEDLRADLDRLHGEKLATLRDHLDRIHGQEMEDLRTDLDRLQGEKLATLRDRLARTAGQEMGSLRADLARTHGQELGNLRADLDRLHGEKLATLRDHLARTHEQEMGSLRADLARTHEKELGNLRADLDRSHREEMAKLHTNLEEKMLNLRVDLDRIHAEKLANLHAELDQEKHKTHARTQQQLKHLEEEHAQELAKIREADVNSQSMAHTQLVAVEKALADKDRMLKTLVHELDLQRDSALLRGSGFSSLGLESELPLPEQARVLRESGRFDIAWYLASNQDVVDCGVDPVLHYLQFGAAEGRNPASDFNTSDYIERHPEIVEGNINPLLHLLLNSDVAPAVHEEGT